MLSNTPAPKNNLLSILHTGKKEGKTEKEIKKHLLKAIKENPDLINEIYTLERSLFHHLVLYQFPEIIDSLLQTEQGLAIARKKDRNGQTILHYAVRSKCYSKKMLHLIIKKLPELIYITDNKLNTPAKIASSEKNTDAENLLSQDKNKTHRFQDVQEHDRRTQSEHEQHFAEQYPSLIRREKPQSLKELTKKFTTLKLSTPSNSRIERLDFQNKLISNDEEKKDDEPLALFTTRSMPEATPLRTPLRVRRKGTSLSDAHDPSTINHTIKNETTLPMADIKLDDLINGRHKKLNAYLTAGGNPNEKIFLGSTGKPLIECAFLCATDNFRNKDIDDNLQLQFFTLLFKAFLPSNQSFIHAVRNRKDSLSLLQTGLKKLREPLFSAQQKYEVQFNELSKKLEKKLYLAGLGQMKLEPLQPKDYTTIQHMLDIDLQLIERIDQICACMQDSNDTQPKFSKELILSYTLGLCNFITPQSLVVCLSVLMKNFSFSQKLVSCLIIKELIEWDVHHELTNDTFSSAVEKFTISLKQRADGDVLPKLSKTLLALLRKKNEFANNVIVKNYTCLQQCLASHIDYKALQDIQPQISSVLQNKAPNKKDTMFFLARELSLFSVLFYQNLNIKELFKEAWKREHKEVTAPNIIQQMQYYNHCTNWIVDNILERTVEEIPLAMSFFVETARVLAQTTGGIGPDLNGHMNVMSAFNKGPISRLQDMIKSHSPQLEKLFGEMSELSSAAHNYKWQREFYSNIPTSLPFFGIYLKDVISANENKDNLLAHLSILGKIFGQILLIQKGVKYEPVIFNSNLIYRLTHDANLDDEAIENRQYGASYRALAPANDNSMDLNTLTNLKDFFENLDDIIEKQYIPNIVLYNQKQYPTHTCALAIIERFHELNKPENKENQEKMKIYTEKLQMILKRYNNTPNSFLILQRLHKHSSSQNLRDKVMSIPTASEKRKEKKKSKQFNTYRP